MKLWERNSKKTIEDAQKVCEQIGIEHIVIDATQEFNNHVINNFINSYKCGQTPNPCVECNKFLKFGVFFNKAKELKCDYIATGHYVKAEFSEKYNQYVLKMADSKEKDQSYFLYGISKDVLPMLIFPLKDIKNKEEVRNIAKRHKLEVAEKKDSQEICFIPDNDYGAFLEKNMDKLPPKGNIILNRTNQILGKHRGLIYYTIGQRKGLGISYKEPLYVVKIDAENNNVIVGTEQELYTKTVESHNVNIMLNIDITNPIKVKAKVRYRSNPAEAELTLKNDIAYLNFEEPQRAVTKGQSVVFYIDDNIILGGGIIK